MQNFFTWEGELMWHRPDGSNIIDCSRRDDVVIDVFSVKYAAAVIHNASSGPYNPQKLPFLLGDLTPSNTWFLWPTRVTHPNGISIGSAVLQGSPTWPTDDRHTDKPRSIDTQDKTNITHVGYVKSQHTDDKSPLKWAWSGSRDPFYSGTAESRVVKFYAQVDYIMS